MEALKYRILSLGDLPKSEGGIYNCSALAKGDKRYLLPRVEKDYMFSNDVQAVLIEGNIEDLKQGKYEKAIYLKRKNFQSLVRIEDFRLFEYQDQLYASHTFVYGWNGSSLSEPQIITPVISKIKIEEEEIEFYDPLELPLKQSKAEKNWAVFVWNGDLYCIYSLDPFIIFKHVGFSWKCVKEEENGLQDFVANKLKGSGYLSLSAMTQWGENFMLGFWHTYINKRYMVQGAFVLDMTTLDIVSFTEPLIDGSQPEWQNQQDYKSGIPYVSGLVVTEDKVEIWCGENDAHTCLIEVNKSDLAGILLVSSYKKQTPMKVLFGDKGLGDYICGMYAIQGWLEENPDRNVNLYLKYGHHFELASVLKMDRVRIIQYTDEKCTVDLTSNENESEYREKITFSDYKRWYSAKLGTNPVAPKTDHIKTIERYEDAIVLCPFAMWPNRTWDINYWKLLAEMLIQRGYHVVIQDMHLTRCKNIQGELYCEKSINDDFKLIKSAKLVIANDSGAAHIAGLVGTPCLVVSGWLDPKAVFSMTKTVGVYNQSTKNPERNLQSITVDHVIEKINELNIKP